MAPDFAVGEWLESQLATLDPEEASQLEKSPVFWLDAVSNNSPVLKTIGQPWGTVSAAGLEMVQILVDLHVGPDSLVAGPFVSLCCCRQARAGFG